MLFLVARKRTTLPVSASLGGSELVNTVDTHSRSPGGKAKRSPAPLPLGLPAAGRDGASWAWLGSLHYIGLILGQFDVSEKPIPSRVGSCPLSIYEGVAE